jgi:cobalamin synthase
MGSPIDKWEGATAYFTGADNPIVMYVILAAAIVVTVLSIIKGGIHEDAAYKKIENGK